MEKSAENLVSVIRVYGKMYEPSRHMISKEDALENHMTLSVFLQITVQKCNDRFLVHK